VRADRLEQVFLTPKGGRLEVLLVLESEAGGRERVRLLAPGAGVGSAAEVAAARFVARWLWHRGGGPAHLLRVRANRGAELADAPAAREALVAELDRLAAEGE
jgi:hypothetical protein